MRGLVGCAEKFKVTSPGIRVILNQARLSCWMAGEVNLGFSGQSSKSARGARTF